MQKIFLCEVTQWYFSKGLNDLLNQVFKWVYIMQEDQIAMYVFQNVGLILKITE